MIHFGGWTDISPPSNIGKLVFLISFNLSNLVRNDGLFKDDILSEVIHWLGQWFDVSRAIFWIVFNYVVDNVVKKTGSHV